MNYLLDTNTCIAFFKNHPSVTAKIEEIGNNSLLLCAPVKAELWYGACKSARVAANQAVLRDFFTQLKSLPFADEAVAHYGEIRAFLAKERLSARMICLSLLLPRHIMYRWSRIMSENFHGCLELWWKIGR